MGEKMDKSSIKNRIDKAECFLLSCIKDGLAHSYDVKKDIWVKPYPEVTGYLLSYFCENYELIPREIVIAAGKLIKIQHKTGGFRSFGENPLFSFDTAQILHGFLSMYNNAREEIYLKASQKCITFLNMAQQENGMIQGIYDIDKKCFIDKGLGFHSGDERHAIQSKSIEAFLLADNIIKEGKYKNMAEKLYDFSLKTAYSYMTHPLGYYLEGILAYGNDTFVKKVLSKNIVPRINNGFLPYSPDLSYAYVSGSIQLAILLFKTGQKEKAMEILEWANRVQDNNESGGLFQYANKDGTLNENVHTEINSWGTKYFCQLNRLFLRE